MRRDEYDTKRREIIDRYTEEICDHEDAGCFGDAENSRKWMRRKLESLDAGYAMGVEQ